MIKITIMPTHQHTQDHRPTPLPLPRLFWSTVVALALPCGAQAAEPGMYAGIHLGQNITSSWPATVDFGAGVRSGGGVGLDNGAHVGVIAGKQTPNARFEAEYQRGRIKVTDASLAAVSAPHSGTGHYDVFMLNAYRTLDLTPQFNAYAGVGIGYAKVKMPELAALAGCNCFRSASDNGLALQARLGTEYSFGSGHHLFAQYTALRLPGASSSGAPSVSYGRKTIGVVTAGYRKTF